MKTIFIDMDDVLVDMVPEWVRQYNRHAWRLGEIVNFEDIKSWDLGGSFKDRELLYRLIDQSDVLSQALPRPGAVEAIKCLVNARFNVYIATYARTESNGAAHRRKLEWLQAHLPWFDLNKVLFIKDKWLLASPDTVLIDDNQDTCEKFEAAGSAWAFCITRPWNEKRIPIYASLAEAAQWTIETWSKEIEE